MTQDSNEHTQTERVSGQPVDARAEIWNGGDDDEPERGPDERRAIDPAGRPEPYVEGPTGPAPLATELRGDPGDEGDRRGEGGAAAGALTGTAVAGPVGGVVGAVAGGALGTADEAAGSDDEDASGAGTDERDDTAGWPRSRVSDVHR